MALGQAKLQKHDPKREKKVIIGIHQNLELCSLKDIVKRVKGQATDWKKVFANYIYVKGLVSMIYRNLKTHKKTI